MISKKPIKFKKTLGNVFFGKESEKTGEEKPVEKSGGKKSIEQPRSNRPLWLAGFRVVSAVIAACVLWLLVEFVPRTSSTPVATWFSQTKG
jgi:hypothetical protein